MLTPQRHLPSIPTLTLTKKILEPSPWPDLNTYPHVLLAGPHELDPSVLDYTHPTTSGDPTWAPDPSLRGAHDPRIDEFGNFKGRVHHTLISKLAQHKHAITPQPIDFEKLRPYFGWVN